MGTFPQVEVYERGNRLSLGWCAQLNCGKLANFWGKPPRSCGKLVQKFLAFDRKNFFADR
jgi:hypothetical protein